MIIKDGNGLNNQSENLRIVTLSQNQWNRRKFTKSSSKYKGVSWHKVRLKWETYIRINGKMKHLGYFNTDVEGAIAYNNAAIEIFEEYASLNKPTKT